MDTTFPAGMAFSIDAFDTLFPSPSNSAPTPVATPSFGFVKEGQSFGGSSEVWSGPIDPASLQARRFIALSTAKKVLGHVNIDEGDMNHSGMQRIKQRLKTKETGDVEESLRILLAHWPDIPLYEEDLVSSDASLLKFLA